MNFRGYTCLELQKGRARVPGIITHTKILKDSIRLLETRSRKTYLLRSIQALFSSEPHIKAAMFGAAGPDIFDFIPVRNKKKYYGHEISFHLHNGGSHALLSAMLDIVNGATDKNTDWAARQRAYLYGMVSHYIADTLINPFLFYFSGFSTSLDKKNMLYFREQNLLHAYNMDSYLLYYSNEGNGFNFSLNEMLPAEKKYGLPGLDNAVKTLILDSMERSCPELYDKIPLSKSRSTGNGLSMLDLVPLFMRAAFRLKWNRNSTLSSLIKQLSRRNMLRSDFLVRYPSKKKINRDLMNLHRGGWQYPGGRAGYRYDSIDELMGQACKQIVDLWERIEQGLYTDPDISIKDLFLLNSYTGEPDIRFEQMKQSSPVKLNPYSKF